MNKLRLNIEDLRIEQFEVQPANPQVPGPEVAFDTGGGCVGGTLAGQGCVGPSGYYSDPCYCNEGYITLSCNPGECA